MRRARDTAAMRRGSVTTTRGVLQPHCPAASATAASRMNWGTCVDFPLPVSAVSNTTWFSRTRSRICFRACATGRLAAPSCSARWADRGLVGPGSGPNQGWACIAPLGPWSLGTRRPWPPQGPSSLAARQLPPARCKPWPPAAAWEPLPAPALGSGSGTGSAVPAPRQAAVSLGAHLTSGRGRACTAGIARNCTGRTRDRTPPDALSHETPRGGSPRSASASLSNVASYTSGAADRDAGSSGPAPGAAARQYATCAGRNPLASMRTQAAAAAASGRPSELLASNAVLVSSSSDIAP
mmetsp:Transcript_86914/g.281482  ORF Transcript_86914/g.281482 Transcript_86914/m.281482 type:complete len:296 (-) Transcript_86914:249-1136(-)